MRRLLFFVYLICTQLLQAQQTCVETVSLPTDAKWGGGDTQGSVLIGNTYTMGNGPGIYIVADGGYRLYLNGELLAYDNAAGRVRFIPMTFLPGVNAISIVGVNGQSAPGVLMHIDELHQSFTSGAGWKVATTPTDNTWKTKNFSDAAWASATVQTLGSTSLTPSGLAVSGFPATSTAKWIWSANNSDKNIVLRYTFTLKAVGYGQNTTGGDGGSIVVVKNIAELVTQATSSAAKIILVPEGVMDCRKYVAQSVCSQTCADKLTNGGYNGDWITNGANCPGVTKTITRRETLIWIKSNKTIIGMGRGASLRGAAFYCNAGSVQTNMIFRNLTIWDVNPHIVEAGDAVSVNAASKLWVEHCTFKWISDGNDIDGTKECTFSWNRWNGYNEYMCTTRDNYSAMIRASDITYDHQWWEGACGRNPKMYGTTLSHTHMINNYHSDNTYYAAESGDVSNLLYIENTHFDGVRFPTVKIGSGVVYCSGNKYTNIGSHQIDWKTAAEPKDAVAKFSVPYSYTLDPVENVKSICTTYCGAGGRWGKLPDFAATAVWSNTAPSVSLTSPIADALFAAPSSITISATATDSDGSIAKVEFYNGTTLLGSDNSSPYSVTIAYPIQCQYSVVAVATDNSGNVTMSWPIRFSVTQPEKKYVYTYDNSSNFQWTNTGSWTPTGVPSSIDTAIVRTGEVRIADLVQVGPVYVEPNGILRLTDTSSVQNLILQGGILKSFTSNPCFLLTSNITVQTASSIMAGSIAASTFELQGTIAGTGSISKTSIGNLRIASSADTYKGFWKIEAGKIQLRSSTGLGQCGVEIDSSGLLDVERDAATNAIVIKPYGVLNLDANLSVQYAVFGNDNLPAGTYTAATLPTYITGAGTLTVTNSIVSASAQSAGVITLTANGGAAYSWSNGTTVLTSSAVCNPSTSGAYSVAITSSAACVVQSAPIFVQKLSLTKGWNLISTNLRSADSSISTLFNGLDVQEIKSMDAFWRNGQTNVFNSLQTITPGEGYLLNMNTAATLSIYGKPLVFSGFQTPVLSNWYLIGCPYQTTKPFSNDFNADNCSFIKNFEGFWNPNDLNSSIQNIEPSKAYFLRK